jgi:MoxR-like ATPase
LGTVQTLIDEPSLSTQGSVTQKGGSVTFAGLPDRAQRASRALLSLGGRAAPGDVGRAAGLSESGQQRALLDLRQAGWVVGSKHMAELTPAALAELAGPRRPDAGALGQALAFWPARQRAFLELLLSEVVARHHLAELEPHLGFIAIGKTGLGKTSLAEVAFELFGLDKVEHTRLVPEQTEGELLGRRYPSSEGFQYELPAVAELPVVLFDEFDKAGPDQRQMAWTYFQGRLEVMRGHHRLTLRPVPIIASNYAPGAHRLAQLRPEYRRRAVVLDVGADKALTAHLEQDLAEFYAGHRWRGLLRLDDLRPPATEDAWARALGKLVRDKMVTEEGLELCADARALELLALGRAALYGAVSAAERAEAAVFTAHDYLVCLGSVEGLVRPGWYLDLAYVALQVAPGASRSALEAAMKASRSQVEQATGSVRRRRRQVEHEDLEHIGQRATFVAELQTAYQRLEGRRLRPELRPEGQGLRAQFRVLIDSASKVGAEGLVDKRELAAVPMAAAASLLARNESLRRAAQRPAVVRMSTRRGPTPEQRRALSSELDQVERFAKSLEVNWRKHKTKPEEDPFAVLRGYRLPDRRPLLVYRPPPAVPPRRPGFRGFLEDVGRGAPSGRWSSALGAGVGYPGAESSCPALSSWGEATRSVIDPALGELYGQEDQLLGMLGRKLRRKRVDVTPRAPRNVLTSGFFAAGWTQPG